VSEGVSPASRADDGSGAAGREVTARSAAGGANGARHVAIIMDGNGRWARRHHLPLAMGHRRGVEAVRKLVRGLGPMGLECLTLYAFSSENWKRPQDEIADLMGLMRRFIKATCPSSSPTMCA
jgi:undecaprenyl diphosphate synthase